MNDERCVQLLKAMRVREQRWFEEDPMHEETGEQVEAFDHAILALTPPKPAGDH